MLRIEKLGEFGAELLDLFIRQDAHTGQIALLAKELDLLIA